MLFFFIYRLAPKQKEELQRGSGHAKPQNFKGIARAGRKDYFARFFAPQPPN
jgi:hypothetical protein